MRSALEEAEKKLEVAREIVKTLQIEEKAIAALGKLDIRVVVFILDLKKLFEDREFASLDEIAQVDHTLIFACV